MTPAHISDLLGPFHLTMDEPRLHQISTYIDVLVHWNARINLTAIRKPKEIVTRHFGESLFAAQHLFPEAIHVGTGLRPVSAERSEAPHLIDVGSGAGFPGLPCKIWNPAIHLTLIESNQKKATFLREVIRTLILTNVNVFPARAETHPLSTADVVTLRAVERFDQTLPVAASLVAPHGRIALLIGPSQLAQVPILAPNLAWDAPVEIPASGARVLLIGTRSTG